MDKSEILPLSVFDHHTIKHKFPFRWSPMGFTSLGIMVDGNLNNLYKLGVCDTISSIHGVAFPLDPEVCLLGNFTNTNLRQSHTIKLTEILLAIAKKCIALKWKLDSSLPVAMWLSEVNSCIPLEKITYCLRNKLKTFYRIWQPFIDYMENLPHITLIKSLYNP